jgi:hypothetical protein
MVQNRPRSSPFSSPPLRKIRQVQTVTAKATKRRRLPPTPRCWPATPPHYPQREKLTGAERIVSTTYGRPVDPKDLLRRRLKPVRKAFGLKPGVAHPLENIRHAG